MREFVTSLYVPVKALAVLGLAYLVFWRVAHFTEVQSVILAFMATALYYLASAASRPPQFEPYYIRATPHWYQIFKDLGLVDDENDQRWKALAGSSEEKGTNSVLRNGITISVLGPELYYSHDHKGFFSAIDLSETIPELLPPEERGKLSSFAPRFYMKLVLEETAKRSHIRAIQFGMVTEESLKKSVHPADDRCNIVLATLPHSVFNGYYNAGKGHFDLDMAVKDSEVEELLTKYGWKRRKRDDDDYWIHWPNELNHKYVDVAYYGI